MILLLFLFLTLGAFPFAVVFAHLLSVRFDPGAALFGVFTRPFAPLRASTVAMFIDPALLAFTGFICLAIASIRRQSLCRVFTACLSIPLALAALATAIRRDIRIFVVKRMTAYAVRLARIVSGRAVTGEEVVAHRLQCQVFWIHTRWIPALMIDSQTIRNRADKMRVAPPMCAGAPQRAIAFAAYRECAIARRVQRAPLPASTRGNVIARVEALLVSHLFSRHVSCPSISTTALPV